MTEGLQDAATASTPQVAVRQDEWMLWGPNDPLTPSPATITLEITTRCNLACVMCPHGLPGGMPIKRDAPSALVARLLENLDEIVEIHPTGVGEPLMAEDFWKLVDVLQGREKPRLTFNTNGILLTEANVQRLSKAAIHRASISVDAASEMTYRRVRGTDMRKTVDGIRRLVKAMRETMPTGRLPIAISMVLMRETIEEAPDFVELAHSLGVSSVYFEHLVDPSMPKEQWIVQRDNFVFNYAEQSLVGHGEYADPYMLKALDVADRLKIWIEGYEVLLLPENMHHNNRPCRTFQWKEGGKARPVDGL